jgi:hypothetical protein
VGFKPIDKAKLGHLVSFRLSEADYAAFRQKVDASGIPMADLCRKLISQENVIVIGHPICTKDYSYALGVLNKVDKVIGRIAREIDQAYASGSVNDAMLDRFLDELVRLNASLEGEVLDAH